MEGLVNREQMSAESTFNPSLIRKNIHDEQQIEKSLHEESVLTKDNTSDIQFDKPALTKQYIQPYNSSNLVKKLLTESISKFQFQKQP